ncbi:MAG: VOC family protein [SAR324 cluster bacterium]|nr:VOC family protein [SAR324 cluster bacterium]
MPSNAPKDNRPPVAIGHVSLRVSEVAESTDFLVKLGLRSIHQSGKFAVLELRGGTHLVLRPTEENIAPGTPSPFDLMVDDVEAARKKYSAAGMEPSAIEKGKIHQWFTLIDPSGYEITVTSSHVGGRVV